MTAWPELDEAIAAARAGDLPRLQALVDWPLCGIAGLRDRAADTGHLVLVLDDED